MRVSTFQHSRGKESCWRFVVEDVLDINLNLSSHKLHSSSILGTAMQVLGLHCRPIAQFFDASMALGSSLYTSTPDSIVDSGELIIDKDLTIIDSFFAELCDLCVELELMEGVEELEGKKKPEVAAIDWEYLIAYKEEHWQNKKEQTRVFPVNTPQNLIHRCHEVGLIKTYQHEGSFLKKVSGQSREVEAQSSFAMNCRRRAIL
ncbi:unnamed protein product [Lepeophtheirus salmonis]|uniref:(salmon louse) hypothetical protein n=1 Tax=Lepeophtheirus salmonis TaxID=72036 RepID=A0A7R8CK84_LEPSM|nr:unnamed protein product [Lepeophtheirus salmonis]CAF2799781.1 unnamed protein product [Lepeophtheirus salmonis]